MPSVRIEAGLVGTRRLHKPSRQETTREVRLTMPWTNSYEIPIYILYAKKTNENKRKGMLFVKIKKLDINIM